MYAQTIPATLFVLIFSLGCGFTGSQGDTKPDERNAELDTILAEGSFDGKEGVKTSGAYRIGRIGDDLRLVLGDNFQTESGPDLFVVLSPQSSDEATGENVMDGTAVRVDSLRSLEGQQTYDLRDDLDLSAFGSVAIQCIQYAHLYGTATLD